MRKDREGGGRRCAYGLLGVASLQDHVSLNRNRAVELSAWNDAANGWPVVLWFLAEQACHAVAAVELLAEHLSSTDTFVARLSTWKSTAVTPADVSEANLSTSQLGVVKEREVQPAASCARATTLPTAGARTAVKTAADMSRVMACRCVLLVAWQGKRRKTSTTTQRSRAVEDRHFDLCSTYYPLTAVADPAAQREQTRSLRFVYEPIPAVIINPYQRMHVPGRGPGS